MQMAERRITRKSQATYLKSKQPTYRERDIIEEEDYGEEIANKAIVTKAKDATVEVTVKVKKRREKSKDPIMQKLIPLPEKEYRKGSWGDLLLAGSRASLVPKDLERDKKFTTNPTGRKGIDSGDCKSVKHKVGDKHSPLCHKIPISDDLYLETHTHIRKSHSAECDTKREGNMKAISLRQKTLILENEELREEIKNLRREVEVTEFRNRAKTFSKTSRLDSYSKDWDMEFPSTKSRPQSQATQTSRNCLTSPKKKTTTCQTDIDGGPTSPPKKLVIPPKSPNVSSTNTNYQPINYGQATQLENIRLEKDPITHLENLRLEKENEALRQDAALLVGRIDAARTEYLECCNTIKELHILAENLKQEKQTLLQSHEHQQTLQSKLLQALVENREIKEVLDCLMNKHKGSHGHEIQDDQLNQIRNVIKDVKQTIAQEMEGLALQPSMSAFLSDNDNVDMYSAGFTFGDSFLNDTNASEVQKILGGEPLETRRGGGYDDCSSSTQYQTLCALPGMDSHYRPSPMAVTNFSPRISTPNSSMGSFSLSEEIGAVGFQPIQPAAATQISLSSVDNDGWRRLEQEVERSFIPVVNELSACSTPSNSRSSGSSPNPRRK